MFGYCKNLRENNGEEDMGQKKRIGSIISRQYFKSILLILAVNIKPK